MSVVREILMCAAGNDQELGFLLQLLHTGLWGNSIEEVALRIIDQKLWEIIPELQQMA